MCAHFSSLKLFIHHKCVMIVVGYHVFWLRIENFLHQFSGLFVMNCAQVKKGKGHFDSQLLNNEDELIFLFFYFVNNPSTLICVTHAQSDSFLIHKLKILLWSCPRICFLSDFFFNMLPSCNQYKLPSCTCLSFKILNFCLSS